jgi:hypothetical protein
MILAKIIILDMLESIKELFKDSVYKVTVDDLRKDGYNRYYSSLCIRLENQKTLVFSALETTLLIEYPFILFRVIDYKRGKRTEQKILYPQDLEKVQNFIDMLKTASRTAP